VYAKYIEHDITLFGPHDSNSRQNVNFVF
jgi:hypothetical protein